MLNLQISKKPVALKPSPPAQELQLSYLYFSAQKLSSEVSLSQHQELMQQIAQLKETVQSREQSLLELKELHLKQVLLLNLELQHQREITSKYDAELRRSEANRN